jgi:hypothetical protein
VAALDVERISVHGHAGAFALPQLTQPMAVGVWFQYIESDNFGGWDAFTASLSTAFRKASLPRRSCQ